MGAFDPKQPFNSPISLTKWSGVRIVFSRGRWSTTDNVQPTRQEEMRNYTPAEITDIANQVCAAYIGENSLPMWYAAYQWQDEPVGPSWLARQELQANLLATGFALPELQAIHRWGFNGASCPAMNDPEILASLQACLHTFRAGTRAQQEASLTDFLAQQRTANAGIGLARVSKWICFVDQARFAILDSRVSRGLYPVSVAPGHRAFPVLAGRAAGAADPIANWRPDRLARTYLNYLDVMQQVAELQDGMQPAQVEMALFMIGQPALPRPLNPRLRRTMWC